MPLSTKRGLGLVFGEGDREGDVMRLGAPHDNSYPMASRYSISYEETSDGNPVFGLYFCGVHSSD